MGDMVKKYSKTMTWKEAITEFTRFLIHEHVINQYVSNYKKRGNVYRDYGFLYNTYIYEQFLRHSFTWNESKEGYWFWHDINIKWNFYLKNAQNKGEY